MQENELNWMQENWKHNQLVLRDQTRKLKQV